MELMSAVVLSLVSGVVGGYGKESIKSLFNRKRNGGASGEQTVLFWRDANKTDIKATIDDVLERSVLPLLIAQSKTLDKLSDSNEKISESLIQLVTLQTMKR